MKEKLNWTAEPLAPVSKLSPVVGIDPVADTLLPTRMLDSTAVVLQVIPAMLRSAIILNPINTLLHPVSFSRLAQVLLLEKGVEINPVAVILLEPIIPPLLRNSRSKLWKRFVSRIIQILQKS